MAQSSNEARFSRSVEERFNITLDQFWIDWFDQDSQRELPLGAFRDVVVPTDFVAQLPSAIWPGFMLPDTLPLIGNEYGDWICVRVRPNNEFGEILHWYHGGGDWIPVGETLVEAILHDLADQIRPSGLQMLRGAEESIVRGHRETLAKQLESPECESWFCESLKNSKKSEYLVQSPRNLVAEFIKSVQEDAYLDALNILASSRLASDAVACDQIEFALQAPLVAIARREAAHSIGRNWNDEFVRALFDVDVFSEAERRKICDSINIPIEHWPKQNWRQAARKAQEVLERRSDLGWAFDVAGWAELRNGNTQRAAQLFFDGRHASAYSDQSVRIRSHWISKKYRKFSIAQFFEMGVESNELREAFDADDYLRLYHAGNDSVELMKRVMNYWFSRGQDAMRENRCEEAYAAFFSAGWDMGVSALADFLPILERLGDAAEASGWMGRCEVARTHHACLANRIN